ncbi:HAMP domain-containing methyl-accepting chemotaxis protein [Clostridium akagii]|uniref:HAMP domain-containing methyl-accepting chemotaxis protein n=1 Tax=Clostridium akagii TaxID=91623 RepID=UPI0005623A04|nr:methyl-accepting chemotaxis protein [Clostridium akagii]
MKLLYNLKIGTKILTGFFMVAIIATVIGIVGMVNLNTLDIKGTEMYEKMTVPMNDLYDMDEAFQKMRSNLRDVVISSNEKDMLDSEDQIKINQVNYNKSSDILKKTLLTDSGKELTKTTDQSIASYENVVDKIMVLAKENKDDEAMALLKGEGAKADNLVEKNMQQLLDLKISLAKTSAASNTATASNSKSIMLGFIIIGAALAILLGILISASITKPIKKLVEFADRLSIGDTDIEISNFSKDETGILMLAFKKMLDNIREQVNAVEKIAAGDLTVEFKVKSEKDVLGKNIVGMVETIKELLLETGKLIKATQEGKLDTRGNADIFNGGWKELISGINEMIDAIVEPIKESAAVLEEISKGDLRVNVNGDYKGEHADIKNALNLTIKSLNEVFREINNAADQVSSGSNQVSDGSQALSQGTTEQASSIEELTSSITEVAAQTKQNAVNSSQANELALKAKDGATLGNSHMKEMLKSMEEINESSSNISKIIKVIDDIAFQTNMLALNAAVEAARAGQHGKGFAVVAEEVRNLAARSTSAAKETTELIEGSIKKVELGRKIADNTAESLDEIVSGVTKAATLVGEIASASNEQATAIYQINKGIEQVSDVVQTNSATAEQSAAASEELSGQASMLKNMVGKFKLKTSASIQYDEHNSVKVEKGKFKNNDDLPVARNRPTISLSNNDFGKY